MTAEHRKLQGILGAIKVLQEKGIEFVVYVTPIDHEGVAKFMRERLLGQVRENIGVGREVLAETGVDVHDFSEALGSEAFCYGYTIHEHLDAKGWAFVAGEIAGIIQVSEAK